MLQRTGLDLNAQERNSLPGSGGELAVGGRDLIALGMKPGREIGNMLEYLLLHVLECPQDNTPEILKNLVKTAQKSE